MAARGTGPRCQGPACAPRAAAAHRPPCPSDERMRTPLRWLREVEFVAALGVVVALWQAAAIHVGRNNVLPSPASVALAWLDLLQGELPVDVAASLTHLALGYGLGLGAGL